MLQRISGKVCCESVSFINWCIVGVACRGLWCVGMVIRKSIAV